MDKIKKYLKNISLSLLAIILLFEEWLWDLLTDFGRYLVGKFNLQPLEERISKLPPWLALGAFLIPLIIVTPLNLFAFWLIAQGHILKGIVLEIFIKLFATILVARVFALTKPQLMTFKAFASVYNFVTDKLNWAKQRIRQSYVYLKIKEIKEAIKRLNLWK